MGDSPHSGEQHGRELGAALLATGVTQAGSTDLDGGIHFNTQ